MTQRITSPRKLAAGAAALAASVVFLSSAAGASAVGPTTSLASSMDPSPNGAPVTFTATVTNPGGGTLLGVVGFSIKNNVGAPVSFTCNGGGTTVGLSRAKPQKAACAVAAGVLTSAASPYQVTATFGAAGGGNSSAMLKQIVGHVLPAVTR